MFVGIPVWQGRVSPVFDVAGQLLVVVLDGGREVGRAQESLGGRTPEGRVQRLGGKRIDTLICAAISQPLQALLAAHQIEVISGICGNVDDVIDAFATGQIHDMRFAMPGRGGSRADDQAKSVPAQPNGSADSPHSGTDQTGIALIGRICDSTQAGEG